MANSAHDEIKILEQDVARLKREINSLGLENAQDMLAIIDLLIEWQDARQAPSMELTRSSVFLTSCEDFQEASAQQKEGAIELTLHSLEIDEAGWTEYLALLPKECISETVTKADILRLAEAKEGDVTFSDRALPLQENLSFAEYVNLLESYQVGRPSTYAPVFEDLTSNHLIDMEAGSIRLTERGLDAIETLSDVMPCNCKVISQDYSTIMQAIADGSLSFDQGLLKMLTPWFAEGELDIGDVFSSLDEIKLDELFD